MGGTAIAAMASLLLLGWSSEYFLPLAVLVCLCRFLQIRDLKSVLWVTIPLMFYRTFPSWGFNVLSPPPSINAILNFQCGDNLINEPALKLATLLLRMGLAYLLFASFRRLKSSGLKLVILHAFLFALIFVCGSLIDLGAMWASLLMSILISFAGFFYCLCYLTLENPSLAACKFFMLYLVPFWDPSPLARPVMDIEPELAKQDLLDRRCRSLALRYSALMLGGSLLEAFLFTRNFHGRPLPFSINPLPRLDSIGFTPSVFLIFPRWKVLLSILWTSFHRISNFFALSVFMECCWLLLAFDVPRRFDFPLRARSFGEFYNGLMPYYVIAISRIYLYPLYFALRRKGWNRYWAYDAALAFAVIAGGLMTHIVRDVHLMPLFGPYSYISSYVIYALPYFFLVFLAVRFVRIPKRIADFLPAPVNFSILLFLYSALFLTRIGGIYVTWQERLEFLRALFLGS